MRLMTLFKVDMTKKLFILDPQISFWHLKIQAFCGAFFASTVCLVVLGGQASSFKID